jgi:two-component system cell cycle response regulator
VPGSFEMKILIADDDPISHEMLRSFLVQWGYDVVTAEDGNAAWEHLQSPHAPRMALLNWMMPGRNGIDVCREMRRQRPEPYTYILLFTAKDAKESFIEGLESGADDCLTKPFHPQELRARIRVGLRLLNLEDNFVQTREAMQFKATHDALTGVWNCGAILETLDQEIGRSRREGASLGVLIAGLDQFQSVNDTHGHSAEDCVLREATQRLRANVRLYDAVGRYAGTQIPILLPGCNRSETENKAERLREAILQQSVETESGPLKITMSMGGVATGDWPEYTASQILRLADLALDRAKEEGKNRTVIAGAAEQEQALRASLELSSHGSKER